MWLLAFRVMSTTFTLSTPGTFPLRDTHRTPAVDSQSSRQAPMSRIRGQISPTEKSALAATPTPPRLRRRNQPRQETDVGRILQLPPRLGILSPKNRLVECTRCTSPTPLGFIGRRGLEGQATTHGLPPPRRVAPKRIAELGGRHPCV